MITKLLWITLFEGEFKNTYVLGLIFDMSKRLGSGLLVELGCGRVLTNTLCSLSILCACTMSDRRMLFGEHHELFLTSQRRTYSDKRRQYHLQHSRDGNLQGDVAMRQFTHMTFELTVARQAQQARTGLKALTSTTAP